MRQVGPKASHSERRRRGWCLVLTYEIKVRGRLSPSLATEFAELSLTAYPELGGTVLRGPVEDQAALYGLLRRLEALGLELVEVHRSVAELENVLRSQGSVKATHAGASTHS